MQYSQHNPPRHGGTFLGDVSPERDQVFDRLGRPDDVHIVDRLERHKLRFVSSFQRHGRIVPAIHVFAARP
jgi:hypothetical protein